MTSCTAQAHSTDCNRTVTLAHQAADVAGAVGLAAPLGWVLQAVSVSLDALVPHGVVALVHGVDLAHLRDLPKARTAGIAHTSSMEQQKKYHGPELMCFNQVAAA